MTEMARQESVSIALGKVLDQSGYLQDLREERSEEAEGRIENLMELVSAAREYESRHPEPTLAGFVDQLSLLSDVGLDASVIDVDAFALHNAFEVNYPEAMVGVVGLVNIGHETTNINILDDGVPVLTRDIPIGTRRFKEDLQRERGLSADEADAVLRGATSSDALDPLLEGRGEELAVGIERAAAFLQSASRSAGGIGRIFTTGGGARIPKLNKVLSDRLRIPVQLANPIEKLQVADGVFDAMPVDEVAPLLMLPIGLALRSAA